MMIKILLWVLPLIAVAYLGLCAMLYGMQRSLLYFPTPATTSPDAETIWLNNENQNLKVWYIPGSGHQALIYFGGNAEDVSENIEHLKRLLPSHHIYLPNYRGFGGSSGVPREAGLFSDALSLHNFVSNQQGQIDVIGRSLGSGIAIYLASRKPLSRLLLVTPYDSITHVAGKHYPYIPVPLLLRDRYNSLPLAKQLNLPMLVLRAEEDEVIPKISTDNLIAELNPELTKVTTIPGSDHGNITTIPDYERALQLFFAPLPQAVTDAATPLEN